MFAKELQKGLRPADTPNTSIYCKAFANSRWPTNNHTQQEDLHTAEHTYDNIKTKTRANCKNAKPCTRMHITDVQQVNRKSTDTGVVVQGHPTK